MQACEMSNNQNARKLNFIYAQIWITKIITKFVVKLLQDARSAM